MMKLFLLAFLLTVYNIGNSQSFTNNWIFGDRAGLTFNTSPPTILNNVKLRFIEGCASISDSAGNLQFYTDGISIWGNDNNLLDNGDSLKGNKTTTQSSLIIPKPGNPTIFYIITLAAQGFTDGLKYSVVDMGLNGGKGKIIQKNISLFGPLSEKLAGVKHLNDTDFWVITQDFTDAKYYAFKLTKDGFTGTVISECGTANILGLYGQGYLKASPDGKYVASCVTPNKLEIYSFNTSSGNLYYLFALNSNYCYSAEFSPSSRFLYANDVSSIYQYDLRYPNEWSISTYRYKISSSDTGVLTLQLGPDGRIYTAHNNNFHPNKPGVLGNYLGVIQNPDMPGAACSYNMRGIFLKNGRSNAGLPNFVSNFVSNFVLNTKSELVDTIPDFRTSINTPDLENVFIPNVITPNGDGLNDCFHIFAAETDNFSIKIYNRYNIVIYESQNVGFLWDGKTDERYPEDMYFYIIHYNKYTYSGILNILK